MRLRRDVGDLPDLEARSRDYVEHRTARGLLVGFLLVLAGIWLVLGMAVIAFFDPGTAPPVGPFS